MRVLDDLLADAVACLRCGRAHECRELNPRDRNGAVTWADPKDGHAYRKPEVSLAWLQQWIAARKASSQ